MENGENRDNEIVTRQEWLQQRQALLIREKAHTRAGDAVAELRRALPWVKVDKAYQFTGEQGQIDFADVFAGKHQLLVYHLMFGESWEAPCMGCAGWANAFNGTTGQFSQADAELVAVSRAPWSMLDAERKKRDWTFRWLSTAEAPATI